MTRPCNFYLKPVCAAAAAPLLSPRPAPLTLLPQLDRTLMTVTPPSERPPLTHSLTHSGLVSGCTLPTQVLARLGPDRAAPATKQRLEG